MPLRETGSILLTAPPERVYEVLRQRMVAEPGLRTLTSRRLESDARTFVLQDAPGGTRVVMARTDDRAATAARREDLRLAVSEELLALQKMVDFSTRGSTVVT